METNKYDVYDNVDFDYYYPYSFNGKNYLFDNNNPFASWNYGDTSYIYFPEIVNLNNVPLILNVYNYRYELVSSYPLEEKEGQLCFFVNKEMSNELFKKGIYPISVIELYYNQETEEQKTLLSSNENYFYVK